MGLPKHMTKVNYFADFLLHSVTIYYMARGLSHASFGGMQSSWLYYWVTFFLKENFVQSHFIPFSCVSRSYAYISKSSQSKVVSHGKVL